MSARVRLAALHDRSGLDLDGLASTCRDIPSSLGWSGLPVQPAFQHVYRTGEDPGEEFWTVLVRASNALWAARELAAGRRCRAARDGDCFAPECPQEIEGRRGYLPHCPLDLDEDPRT